MPEMPETVAADVVVTIEYTLRNSAGEVLDSSSGDEPLSYLHGHDNIVPGLEGALTGKKKGDELTVTVAPEAGYGLRDPAGVRQLEREAFPEDADLSPGVQFLAELEDGSHMAMWVVAVDEQHVHVDMNHPLAGETLHFQVKIVDLRAANPNELQHGHPHGRDGHAHHHH